MMPENNTPIDRIFSLGQRVAEGLATPGEAIEWIGLIGSNELHQHAADMVADNMKKLDDAYMAAIVRIDRQARRIKELEGIIRDFERERDTNAS